MNRCIETKEMKEQREVEENQAAIEMLSK